MAHETAAACAPYMSVDLTPSASMTTLAGDSATYRRLSHMLLELGVPASIQGYKFIREAVLIIMQDPDKITGIVKLLYPQIARKFNSSGSRVERAIRHAIEVSWYRRRFEHINSVFGVDVFDKNDKPTNSEFIALLADKMLLDKYADEERLRRNR